MTEVPEIWTRIAGDLARMQQVWLMTVGGMRDVLLSDEAMATLIDELGEARAVITWTGIQNTMKDGLAAIEKAAAIVGDSELLEASAKAAAVSAEQATQVSAAAVAKLAEVEALIARANAAIDEVRREAAAALLIAGQAQGDASAALEQLSALVKQCTDLDAAGKALSAALVVERGRIDALESAVADLLRRELRASFVGELEDAVSPVPWEPRKGGRLLGLRAWMGAASSAMVAVTLLDRSEPVAALNLPAGQRYAELPLDAAIGAGSSFTVAVSARDGSDLMLILEYV